MPTLEGVYQQAEEWMKRIRQIDDSILTSVMIFNNEPLFCQITQSRPVLLIVCDVTSKRLQKIITTITLKPTKKLYPFLITTEEAQNLAMVHPLELLHIKSGYNVLFGDDPLSSLEIDSIQLTRQIETELMSTLWHMRSISLTITKTNLVQALREVHKRLYPAFKGVLYLKGNLVPAQWIETLTSLESRFTLESFPFSRSITVLEKNKKAVSKLHPTLFVEIQEALETLVTSLSRS